MTDHLRSFFCHTNGTTSLLRTQTLLEVTYLWKGNTSVSNLAIPLYIDAALLNLAQEIPRVLPRLDKQPRLGAQILATPGRDETIFRNSRLHKTQANTQK